MRMPDLNPLPTGLRAQWGARRIGVSQIANTGKIAFKWGAQASESELEAGFLKILAFDPEVADVKTQPVTLYWKDRSGVSRRYTPDAFVQYRRQVEDPSLGKGYIVEVKPAAVYEKYKEDLEVAYDVARTWASRGGYEFHVVTEQSITPGRVWNSQFLMRYASPELMLNTEEARQRSRRVRSCMDSLEVATPDSLLVAVSSDNREWPYLLPQIWHLVATREFLVDLDQQLGMGSLITVRRQRDRRGPTWSIK